MRVFKDSQYQECLLLVWFYGCSARKSHQWGSVLTMLQAHVRSATPNTIAVKSNLETLQNRTWQLSHKAPVICFVWSYLRSFILLNCNTSSYHLFLTYYFNLLFTSKHPYNVHPSERTSFNTKSVAQHYLSSEFLLLQLNLCNSIPVQILQRLQSSSVTYS